MSAGISVDVDYCCQAGCGDGGCETCPCCVAGWCIGFRDGDPSSDELAHVNADLNRWNFDWWAYLCLSERGYTAVDPGPMP